MVSYSSVDVEAESIRIDFKQTGCLDSDGTFLGKDRQQIPRRTELIITTSPNVHVQWPGRRCESKFRIA